MNSVCIMKRRLPRRAQRARSYGLIQGVGRDPEASWRRHAILVVSGRRRFRISQTRGAQAKHGLPPRSCVQLCSWSIIA